MRGRNQLGLSLRIREAATLDNFMSSADPARKGLVALLQSAQLREFVYIWGGKGCGKTHILEAACHHYDSLGYITDYLALDQCLELPPAELLQGREHAKLVCLSNIDAVAGRPDWEKALFDLYNRIKDCGHLLMVSALAPATQLQLSLADLKSRLLACLVIRFAPYSDAEKQAILQFRARRTGLEMSDEVATYLMARSERDLSGLITKLNELDEASLAEKRRLTIPFVRQVFDW